jgi:hypothetical protein
MPKHMRAVALTLAILAVLIPVSILAVPSAKYYQEGGEIFDDWDICRTDAAGEDGFFRISATGFHPVIVGESLGQNADQAYRIGQQFAGEYQDIDQRAEEIFAFARDRVRYTSDESLFGFAEFAQNADEVALTIADEGVAHGDCEDYAVLLAVMYKGAGFRSAIVLAPEHAAALVCLPGYREANRSLSVDGEAGWIWAEATGGNNLLGWMPEEFLGTDLEGYEVEDEAIIKGEPPDKPLIDITPNSGGGGIHISPFFIVIGILFLISLFRRRR